MGDRLSDFADPEFHRLYKREGVIEAFLERIENERERQGITRVQLAERMGCSPANITRIMRRTANLTVATMVDMADALGLQIAVTLAPRRRPRRRG